jgi:hypothetical protein
VSQYTNRSAPVPTTENLRLCPIAAVQWNGPAYDPATNLLYMNGIDWCAKAIKGPLPEYVRGKPYLGWATPTGYGDRDPIEEAFGLLNAIDPSNGEVKWRYRIPAPPVAGLTATAGGRRHAERVHCDSQRGLRHGSRPGNGLGLSSIIQRHGVEFVFLVIEQQDVDRIIGAQAGNDPPEHPGDRGGPRFSHVSQIFHIVPSVVMGKRGDMPRLPGLRLESSLRSNSRIKSLSSSSAPRLCRVAGERHSPRKVRSARINPCMQPHEISIRTSVTSGFLRINNLAIVFLLFEGFSEGLRAKGETSAYPPRHLPR